MASSATPKLIIPEDKSTNETKTSTSGSNTRKLTKILSTQTSFERHHSPYPIGKRFSIDADPKSIILNTPILDFTNKSDTDEYSSSPLSLQRKQSSPARSPSLKKSDSFLEIPYEKGEIVDLIKFADDPNAATHITDDGQEVLLEHAVTTQQ